MNARVAGWSSARRRPCATSSSTHMIAGPPASETTATRFPRGSGCREKAIARSNSSSIEAARSTPVCANTASAARSDPPSDPVCDAAARLPASERRGRSERRIHPDIRMGIDDPHAVRANHPQVVSLAKGEQAGFPLDARSADLAETGSDHDEALHTLLPAFLGGLHREIRGDRDHREVDGVRDVPEARIGADAVDARRPWVYWGEGSPG